MTTQLGTSVAAPQWATAVEEWDGSARLVIREVAAEPWPVKICAFQDRDGSVSDISVNVESLDGETLSVLAMVQAADVLRAVSRDLDVVRVEQVKQLAPSMVGDDAFESLGVVIRLYADLAGVSLRELANQAGIPLSSFTRKMATPARFRVPELGSIGDVLGVGLSRLVRDAESLREA